MDHPPSPNRGGHSHLIQGGHSPTSPVVPPVGHHTNMPPDAMVSGYRGMPPASYGHPTGYLPFQGHVGAPPQSPFGASAPPSLGHGYPRGQPPASGFPGASYPPPHQSPSYSTYGYHPGAGVPPGAGRLPYYGFEGGGYPGQPGQPPQSARTASSPSPYRSAHGRPVRPTAPTSSPDSLHQPSSPHASLQMPKSNPQVSCHPKASPERSLESTSQPASLAKLPENAVEVERLRAAAAQELTTEEVRPIETDFHFFVKENLEHHKKIAEEEVRKYTNRESGELDPYLVNSNLNSRLLAAWENSSKETRDSYRQKEEEDRVRFMAEDEIASRHCATLTARGKTSRDTNLKKKEEQRQEINSKSPNRYSPMVKSEPALGPSSPRAAAVDSETAKQSAKGPAAEGGIPSKDSSSEVPTAVRKETTVTASQPRAEDEAVTESPQKKIRTAENTEAL